MPRTLTVTMAVLALALLGGCKEKPAGGGAATPGATDAAAAATAAGAGTAGALLVDEDNSDVGLGAAFDGKVPLLPAISRDGTRQASFVGSAEEPMSIYPYDFSISAVDGKAKPEKLELIDLKMATDATVEDDKWTNAPLDLLHQRAASIRQKLAEGGFTSLVPVATPVTSEGEKLPAQIGDLTLVADDHEGEELDLRLCDARGRSLHREHVGAASQGKGDQACTYRPTLGTVHYDPPRHRLFVEVGYRYRDDCGAIPGDSFVWDVPAAAAEHATAARADLDAVRKLFAAQFGAFEKKHDLAAFADDAQVFSQKGLGTRDQLGFEITEPGLVYGDHQDHDLDIAIAADGKSAWASAIVDVEQTTKNAGRATFTWRVSDVMVKSDAGWRVAAVAITKPVENDTLAKQAKAGRWPRVPLTGPAGDPELQAAFAKLLSDGVDAPAAGNEDLVTVGSGPGERTVGGTKIAKPWAAAWKGRAKLLSSVARVAPSGTTGWVAATIELERGAGGKGYRVPFLVFCVFDKAGGAWSLAHMHLAV